jgi:hypothetical protein
LKKIEEGLFRKSPIHEVMSKKTWSSSPENFVQ